MNLMEFLLGRGIDMPDVGAQIQRFKRDEQRIVGFIMAALQLEAKLISDAIQANPTSPDLSRVNQFGIEFGQLIVKGLSELRRAIAKPKPLAWLGSVFGAGKFDPLENWRKEVVSFARRYDMGADVINLLIN